MKDNNKKIYIIVSSLIACAILYFVEQIMLVDYVSKTLAKIVLFTLVPYIYIKLKKSTIKNALNLRKQDKKDLKIGLLFGAVAFFIILVTYYLLSNVIDVNDIVNELQNKSKITPTNFAFVGLYITLGNSFLEEFFFRGFIFLNLYELKSKKLAYVYSSILFGIYHIAIFRTWFNPWLIGLALFGLISVAVIFNWLDTKSKNFMNSWIVHILADAAIILIGLRMFYII